jgi:hypothetical protein
MPPETWLKRKISRVLNIKNYNSFQIVIFRHQGKVTVWTGTYEILTYPDVNGNDVAIYLWVDGDKKYIPAPKYYWKVLKNEKDGKAVAFVGLNDPHADDVDAATAFCTSRCSEIVG